MKPIFLSPPDSKSCLHFMAHGSRHLSLRNTTMICQDLSESIILVIPAHQLPPRLTPCAIYCVGLMQAIQEEILNSSRGPQLTPPANLMTPPSFAVEPIVLTNQWGRICVQCVQGRVFSQSVCQPARCPSNTKQRKPAILPAVSQFSASARHCVKGTAITNDLWALLSARFLCSTLSYNCLLLKVINLEYLHTSINVAKTKSSFCICLCQYLIHSTYKNREVAQHCPQDCRVHWDGLVCPCIPPFCVRIPSDIQLLFLISRLRDNVLAQPSAFQ